MLFALQHVIQSAVFLSSMKKIVLPSFYLCLAAIFILFPSANFAQIQDSIISTDSLKKFSLEDLMNIEVTSVSKRPEKLNEAASAIQVITGDDIRNAGVKTLPEALKLAANIQIAQVNSSQWAISSRGFNNVLANKLLVLIDGRTVYTPMYAGVFWDVQNLLLEDVDRIEVISGPGGTLWGANAVNGIINIITKNAANTKGVLVEGAYGNAMPGTASIRYGGKITKNISFRVYATGFKMASVVDTNGVSVKDEWEMAQGGFRVDWKASEKDHVTLQSNIYYGRPNPESDTTAIIASGDNALVKWNHKLSDKSDKGDFQLQVYYDHTWRDFGNKFTEDLKTYDIDWQNRFQLGKRHTVMYGLGYRQMEHRVANLELFGFFPKNKTLLLYSGFLQYEVMIIKERLRFTIGSKVEHHTYTEFQYQPNVRLTCTPTKHHTIWAAASRAVRNPARIDREFSVSLFPNFPVIMGSDSFMPENVIAYELGWRFQPGKKLSLSLSGFYNEYDNLRSAEPGPPPFGYPITFANGVKGESYGAELAFNAQIAKWWNLRGGYTFFKKDLVVKPNSKDLNKASAESNDPAHQILLQSIVNLPYGFQFGTVARLVDSLPNPDVPQYFGLDLKLGWKWKKYLEISVVGQNLLYDRHREFIASSPIREIERSVYGKITCRF